MYPQSDSHVHLIQLSRWPIIGKVKTRLISSLGPEGAFQVHCELVGRTFKTLLESGVGQVYLLWDSLPVDKVFPEGAAGLSKPENVCFGLQRGQDLGERMMNACRDSFQVVERVILVGSDCPDLSSDYLAKAAEALRVAPLVLGPAEDGGYVLIGMRYDIDDWAQLFQKIDWGTAYVLEQTLERAQAASIPYELLPTLWDVDYPEDYVRYKKKPHQSAGEESF